jgi:hypothetical protein
MLFTRQATEEDPYAGFIFYNYAPSMAAAIIFVLLFGATSILHSVQMSMTRTWFMIPFVIGGFCKSNTTYAVHEKQEEGLLTIIFS